MLVANCRGGSAPASTPRQWTDSERTWFALQGVGLLVLSGAVVVIRAYYKSARHNAAHAQEVQAFSLLSRSRKNITVQLVVSDDELATLRAGELSVTPTRFHMPIQPGDTVELYTVREPKNITRAFLQRIDGYHQRIILHPAQHRQKWQKFLLRK